MSLSARRAWIEIGAVTPMQIGIMVALRKESVDRNCFWLCRGRRGAGSLSARRAWIEIVNSFESNLNFAGRSPQGERG